MLAPVHEVRVGAERDVVQEDAVADAADVDPPLAPLECADRGRRVIQVESRVPRKVVARPEWDAHEGQVALDRHLRDGAERAVAAGHPECLRVGGRRERRRIVLLAEDVGPDAPPFRLLEQRREALLRRARTRVHEQEAGHRSSASCPFTGCGSVPHPEQEQPEA